MSVESVLLRVPLAANTGYGHDGFALTRALDQAGYDVRLLPTVVTPPIPMGVAATLTKPVDLNFDYYISHVDPGGLGFEDGMGGRIQGRKVAWTMWEFTKLTDALTEGMTSRLQGYDDLLVYDEVSYAALSPHASEAGVRLRILQGGYWADDWQFDSRERDWNAPFRFCMAGQLHQRKNPFAAIKAFVEVRKKFPDVELHLKTNVRTLHPAMEQAYPGLKIHYEVWDHKQMREFYAKSHCYLAPSWGEGKNLPALEAQSMGIPVIYSNFGGHRQWGSADWGWPVNGPLVDHEGLPHIEVDHDEMVAAMMDAVGNREKTREFGFKASRTIPAMCDWSNVVQRLRTMLNQA